MSVLWGMEQKLLTSYTRVPQSTIWESLWVPKTFLWGPCGQKYFYYKTEKLFAFLTFFHERTTEFSRDNVTRYHKRLSAKHIQKSTYLFLYKTLKRFTKNINQCHSSHFYLKNIIFFHFKIYIFISYCSYNKLSKFSSLKQHIYYNSGVQKSEMDFTKPKSRSLQVCFPFWRPYGRIHSFTFSSFERLPTFLG